jgi:hypothetical protein
MMALVALIVVLILAAIYYAADFASRGPLT